MLGGSVRTHVKQPATFNFPHPVALFPVLAPDTRTLIKERSRAEFWIIVQKGSCVCVCARARAYQTQGSMHRPVFSLHVCVCVCMCVCVCTLFLVIESHHVFSLNCGFVTEIFEGLEYHCAKKRWVPFGRRSIELLPSSDVLVLNA